MWTRMHWSWRLRRTAGPLTLPTITLGDKQAKCTLACECYDIGGHGGIQRRQDTARSEEAEDDYDTEGDIICTPQQDTSISDPIVNECSMPDIIKSDPAINESFEHHIRKSDPIVHESPTHDSIKLGRHEHETCGRVGTKDVISPKEDGGSDQGSISPAPD